MLVLGVWAELEVALMCGVTDGTWTGVDAWLKIEVTVD
jgi:hypothetical protein